MGVQRAVNNGELRFYAEDKEVLRIKEDLNDTEVTISLCGNLISETTYDFLDELLALVSVGIDIIVDFSDVKYISASYIKALLKVQLKLDKKNKGTLKLTGMPDAVFAEFEKTGASELLLIE